MRFRSGLFTLALVVLSIPGGLVADNTADAQALLQTARGANPFGSGLGAFTLTADLTLYKFHKGDERGTYKLVWLSAKDWRRDVKSASFESSEGVMQGVGWAKNDTVWPPFRLRQLEDLRNAFAEVTSVSPAAKVTMKRSKQNTCWKIEEKERMPLDFCAANDSGAIQSVGYKNAVYELKGLTDSNGRKLPQSVSVIVNGMKIVEMSNLHLEALAGPSPDLAPPAGAWKEESLACALGQGRIIKKIAPEYPAIARETNDYGVVTVGVVVGTDGEVKSIAVLQTAGPRLDRAVMEAVKNWRFEPFQCGGHAVEALSDVSINFSAPHSDFTKGSVPLLR